MIQNSYKLRRLLYYGKELFLSSIGLIFLILSGLGLNVSKDFFFVSILMATLCVVKGLRQDKDTFSVLVFFFFGIVRYVLFVNGFFDENRLMLSFISTLASIFVGYGSIKFVNRLLKTLLKLEMIQVTLQWRYRVLDLWGLLEKRLLDENYPFMIGLVTLTRFGFFFGTVVLAIHTHNKISFLVWGVFLYIALLDLVLKKVYNNIFKIFNGYKDLLFDQIFFFTIEGLLVYMDVVSISRRVKKQEPCLHAPTRFFMMDPESLEAAGKITSGDTGKIGGGGEPPKKPETSLLRRYTKKLERVAIDPLVDLGEHCTKTSVDQLKKGIDKHPGKVATIFVGAGVAFAASYMMGSDQDAILSIKEKKEHIDNACRQTSDEDRRATLCQMQNEGYIQNFRREYEKLPKVYQEGRTLKKECLSTDRRVAEEINKGIESNTLKLSVRNGKVVYEIKKK